MIFLYLLACYPEEQFKTDLDDEVCLWKSDCFGEVFEVCVENTQASHEDTTGCEYDPAAARECVKGWRDLQCPGESISEEEVASPESCLEVWDCS